MHSKIFSVTILSSALIAGCSKPNNDTRTYEYFRAYVASAANGSGMETFGLIDTKKTALGNGIEISGINLAPTYNPDEIITITIPNFTGPGVYNFNGAAYAKYTFPGGTPVETSANGSVTITSTEPDLTGTFNFSCLDSTKITNGAFSMKER